MEIPSSLLCCAPTITRDVGARHANVQILRKPVCGGAEPLFSRLASLARLSTSSTSSELWSRIFVIISSSLSSRIPSRRHACYVQETVTFSCDERLQKGKGNTFGFSVPCAGRFSVLSCKNTAGIRTASASATVAAKVIVDMEHIALTWKRQSDAAPEFVQASRQPPMIIGGLPLALVKQQIR